MTASQCVSASQECGTGLINCFADSQGLAFPALSKQGVAPPFFNMLQERLLDAPEFSIWLNKDTREGVFPAGELLLGGINPARYSGELQYHQVIGTR